MIIFWTNFGGGGRPQGGVEFLPLLFFLIPLLSSLFGGGGFGFSSTTYVYDPREGWVRVVDDPRAPSSSSWGSLVAELIPLAALIASLVLGFFMVRRAAQRQQQQQQHGGGGRGHAAPRRSHSERLAAAAALIQRLPIAVHHTRAELESMGPAELKALLRKAGRAEAAATALEKQELVAAAAAAANSSEETCSICMEDYGAGDVLRVLPRCGHRFHLECADRWFLSSTDYSRPPACPMCNQELEGDGDAG